MTIRSVKAAEAAVLWTGWTILKDNGTIAVDADFGEPFLWVDRNGALETCEDGDRPALCEIRLAALRAKKARAP
jgi:hypothetical protein